MAFGRVPWQTAVVWQSRGWRKAIRGTGRGLCRHCYDTPAVRARYPAADYPRGCVQADPGPTAAELEAMIAEQLPTMPLCPGRERGRIPRKARG